MNTLPPSVALLSLICDKMLARGAQPEFPISSWGLADLKHDLQCHIGTLTPEQMRYGQVLECAVNRYAIMIAHFNGDQNGKWRGHMDMLAHCIVIAAKHLSRSSCRLATRDFVDDILHHPTSTCRALKPHIIYVLDRCHECALRNLPENGDGALIINAFHSVLVRNFDEVFHCHRQFLKH